MTRLKRGPLPWGRGKPASFALALFIFGTTLLLAGCAGVVVHGSATATQLEITSNSVPSAKTQTPYSAMLLATGGTAPYAWAVASGSLPTGLSLSASTGQINGTPTQAGNSSFAVQVTDSSTPAQTAKQPLSLAVAASMPALQITSGAIPSGQVGVEYSTTLLATGGTTPYTWAVSSGALPPGLSLNSSTGQIGGTPTQSGSFTSVMQVRDSSSPVQVATQALSTTIAASVTPIAITTLSLPNGQQGAAYSSSLSVSGGTAPYTWSISSGQLPTGTSLNSSSGAITGTPTQSGLFYFTVKVADSGSSVLSATANLSIQIAATATALQISTTSLPAGATFTAYDAIVTATGGTTPYVWSLQSGALPPGLTLSASGQISGTPTQNGSFTFTIGVKDSSSTSQTATKSLSISVVLNGGSLAVTTVSLPNGQAGVSYSAPISAIGGVEPYTWSVSSGALPAGLMLNSPSSVISGTPTQSGSFTFTLQVQDSSATPQTATKSFSVTISSAVVAVSITTGSLTSGQVSSSYGATLTASGGTTPYTWSVSSGSLPAGLNLNASTGQISGTPTQAGTSSFTVQVQDSSSPSQKATKSLSITIVVAVTPVQITTTSIPSGQVGTAYSTSLAASGGTTPYSWSLASGALPAGVTLSASGTISGTPTASGSFSFTARVTDSTTPTAQTASQSLTLTVAAAITAVQITASSVPSGQTGTAYSATLAATGGTTPYTWSIGAGALPGGLNLSSGGTISGTPTASGSFSFTAKVTDSTTPTAQTATKAFSITITAAVTPIQITTASVPSGQTGTAYSTTLTATGGTTPYTWSISAGALPGGLNLSSVGTISGTPTASGSFSLTAKVTDSTTPTAQTATKAFSITITTAVTPLQITTTSMPSGQTGTAYSTTLTAIGGTTPYTWSINSGALPTGLTLSTAGVISGTPSATGTFSFTVKVTDSSSPANSATANFSITVSSSSAYSVLLNWTASPSSGVTGYNVYRSNVSGTGYSKINPSPVAALSYIDATVTDGQTYYYVTTAVDGSGDESGFSDEVDLVIP